MVARQLQAQELAIFVGQVSALANAWPGADGKIRRDSTGMSQGVRRGNKRQRRAGSGVGKGRGGGGVALPVAVALPRVDATVLPRPLPIPSPPLRERKPRTMPPSVNGGGSRVICACHRPLVLDLKDSVPARGVPRWPCFCCKCSLPLAPLLSSSVANGVDKKKSVFGSYLLGHEDTVTHFVALPNLQEDEGVLR